MITKREKLQYGYLFLIDLLSLVLSIGLAWGLTAGVLHKMGDFQLDDLVEACFLLLLAYILTFFTFDQSENIVNRTPIREVEIAVRFNFLLTLIDAACLALTKASMLHSRYFLVFVPVIDVFVMTGAHAVLKKMLVRSRYTKGIQSLVGVVTTQENASPILEELKKDWSKRVTGLAILEAAPEQLHTEIDGVKIEANFDNFMDWLRQAALDEVYLDVAQESEENMLPYLEEMESMGLTVHFRLPVLDRIEKACWRDFHGAAVGGHPAQVGKPRPADLQAAPGGSEWTCVLHPQAAQHVCGRGGTQKGADGPERNERPDVQDGG